MKQAIEQGTVREKECAKVFIDCEDAMAVCDIDQFKRHAGGAFHGIFIAAGRAEAAMTAEGNKLEFTAVRTAVHGTTKGWITAVNHLIDIFHLSFSGMKSIYNFFIVVRKDILQDIHKTIMHEKGNKRNPPLKNEGQGS